MATTLLSLVNLFTTFLAMFMMERAGRRYLMLITWIGMCSVRLLYYYYCYYYYCYYY